MILPNGWKKVRLSQISQVIMVGIASSATHAYRDSGVIMLRNLNIKENRIDESNLRFIDPEYEHQHKRKRLKTGDILTVRTGYPGLSAVVSSKFNNTQCFTSLITRPISNLVDSNYLCFFINSDQGHRFIASGKAGGAQKNVNVSVLSKMPVILPPIKEQKKIVTILTTWDEAIRLTQELITAKRQRKKGLMQRLLTGQVRFPEFETRTWNEATLTEISEIMTSNVDKKTKPNELPVRLCNYTDVFNNGYIKNSMAFMKASASQREVSRFTLQENDVIITKDSETREEIAEPAVVIEELENVLCGYHLVIIRPEPTKVFGPFLKDLLLLPSVRYQFASKANGITRFGLTQSTIHGIKLLLPSFEEQQRISNVLQACDREIELLQLKVNALQKQKKGLMQRLLTGKIRVKV